QIEGSTGMTKVDRRALLTAGGALGVAALGVAGAKVMGAANAASPKAAPDFGGRIPVAFVMGPGSTMIDFAGPWEVFQDAGDGNNQAFFLYTVSDSTDEIQTTGNFLNNRMSGLRFRPDYSFADAPQPKVIMMGAQGGHTAAKIAWITRAAQGADVVFSNCTGAFL